MASRSSRRAKNVPRGWATTYEAEYMALTKLQADVFVTSGRELARAVSGLVETATVDPLRTA
jgi:hypothetical protein